MIDVLVFTLGGFVALMAMIMYYLDWLEFKDDEDEK